MTSPCMTDVGSILALPECPSNARILGLDESGLIAFEEHYLMPDVVNAFQQLRIAAGASGFDLRIASAYRSYQRQQQIWNDKLRGLRPVFDDADREIDISEQSDAKKIESVLRFSALPGTSRHHWGTDMDVYDHAAIEEGYRLQLSTAEVESGGCCAPLHDWLDERIAAGESFGFYRPFDQDRGGVARERWHLSYAPMAMLCENALNASLLRHLWSTNPSCGNLCLREALEPRLESLIERYTKRVSVPPAAARVFRTACDSTPGG